jgi:hypothetical protein
MTDNIVTRLRDLGDRAAFEPSAHHKAADEIERLREVLRYDEIHRSKETELAQAKVNELNLKLVKQLDQMRKDNAKLRAEIRELNAAGAEFETPALPAKGK